MDEGEDVDDGKLRMRDATDPDDGEDEEAETDAVREPRPLHQPVLEEEDQRQDADGDNEDADLDRVGAPDAPPHGMSAAAARGGSPTRPAP